MFIELLAKPTSTTAEYNNLQHKRIWRRYRRAQRSVA